MSTTITLHKRSYGRSFGVPSHLWLETQENPRTMRPTPARRRPGKHNPAVKPQEGPLAKWRRGPSLRPSSTHMQVSSKARQRLPNPTTRVRFLPLCKHHRLPGAPGTRAHCQKARGDASTTNSTVTARPPPPGGKHPANIRQGTMQRDETRRGKPPRPAGAPLSTTRPNENRWGATGVSPKRRRARTVNPPQLTTHRRFESSHSHAE